MRFDSVKELNGEAFRRLTVQRRTFEAMVAVLLVLTSDMLSFLRNRCEKIANLAVLPKRQIADSKRQASTYPLEATR
jgi:hypothetical protein